MRTFIFITILFYSSFSFSAEEESFSVDFHNLSISEIIPLISQKTGDSFVLALGVDKKITWTEQDLYLKNFTHKFLTTLTAAGCVIHKTNGTYIITDSSAPFVDSKGSLGFVTLKHISAKTLKDASKNIYKGRLGIYPVGDEKTDEQSLVLSGDPADIKQFSRLVKVVDKPKELFFTSVQLSHIPVSSALKSIQEHYGKNPDVTCSADYWNRSIILRGQAFARDPVELFIRSMDKPRQGFISKYVSLSSVKAASVITMLSAAYPDLKATPLDEKRVVLSGDSANVGEAMNLIGKVDAAGVQVKIEAVISYLTNKKFEELGVRFRASSGNFQLALNDPIFGTSVKLLSEGFAKFLSLSVAAEDGHNSGNIISSPTLFVKNGAVGRLHVGQNVPVLSQANYDKNDGSSTGTDIERKDVGLTFSVTPLVDPSGDFVDIKLTQVVSSVSDSLGDAIDVVFDTQELSSSVRVANGQTIFLGGLVVSESQKSIDKIPFLSSVPVIGKAFTYKGDSFSQRNLVVTLRATIIK